VLFVLTLARKLRHWYQVCQVSNCAEPKYVLKFTFFATISQNSLIFGLP